MAPIIRDIEETDSLELYLIHTGQHYDANLSGTFFDTLSLPSPDLNLDIRSGTHGEQTAFALEAIERCILDRDPDILLSQGDTNAVLSAAIAASKTNVKFGHVEAGIRSFDRSMPEETNRVIADAVADLAFAPTEEAEANLQEENIFGDIYVTGNTVVDACLEHISIAREKTDILSRLGLEDEKYAVATIHRPQNTDDSARLERIIRSLEAVKFQVIFTAHPRTQTAIEDLEYEPSGSLNIVEPLDYLLFLELLSNARLVVTDSGGIQEEASILEVPCLTVRPNTERPETVEVGVNELIEPEDIVGKMTQIFERDKAHSLMRGHSDLYGDGNASDEIVRIIKESV